MAVEGEGKSALRISPGDAHHLARPLNKQEQRHVRTRNS